MQPEKGSENNLEKCLRHQIYKTARYCRLCEAKKEAKGKSEYARLIYLYGNSK